MEQIGEVTAVRGRMLEITFCRPEECEKCHGCEGHHRPSVLTIEGLANVGDTAIVSMPDRTLVKASLLAYVMPVAGLLLGLAAGSAIFGSDLAAAAGGLIGLGLCAGIVALTERKRRGNAAWQPVVTRIIPRMVKPE